MAEWQPIETAPKDGTVIDLWWQGPDEWEKYRIPDCHYRDEQYWIDDSGNLVEEEYITHWMPLPEPPEENSDGHG